MPILAFIAVISTILLLLPGPNNYLSGLENWSTKQYLNNSSPPPQSRPKIETKYTAIPTKIKSADSLSIEASAALIIDPVSQTVLYSKSSDKKLPMASLTKLMSALVLMNRHKPDEIVTVPDLPVEADAQSQKVNLVAGEKFRFDEALRIMLIYSANDIANALAIWDSGTIDKFVNKMNQEAKYWDLKNTNFSNPTGLDGDSKHHTTADDLARLSRVLLNSDSFRKIVNTTNVKISNQAGKIYEITSTNQLLLRRTDVAGIKTGFDDTAGQCLVTLAKQGDRQVITVVLNSPDRFTESENMIEWAFRNNTWQ